LLTTKGKDRVKFLEDEADRGQVSAGVENAIQAARTVAELAAALDPIVDERGSPKKHPIAAGRPILQPTDERRRTGSHYTPRTLTAPIVEHALAQAFERLGPDATPEQILDLKVCDPAMGSGAFLVEACRALATRLVQAWARHPEKKPKNIPPDEDDELHAKRLVAQRCLYGVDKNPLATDLAKLSLWLATLARDHEFTFLDHALKSGDSLVGLSQAQIAAAHWDTSKPGLPLFRKLVKDRVEEAMKGRAEIQAAPDDTARAIQEQRHRSLESRLKAIRLMGDAVIAAFFSEQKPKAREKKRAEVESWLTGSVEADWDKLGRMAATLQQGANPITPFHWEVEFPEVFARENSGFDVVVGNPPFVDSETMTREIPEIRDYIANHYSCAKGNWDLYVPFIEKAMSISGTSGTTALISPNKWFGAPYAAALREKNKDKLSAVLDFSNSRAFPGVGVAAICSLLRQIQTPSIELLRVSATGEAPKSVKVDRRIIQGETWGMLLSSHLEMLSGLLSGGVQLGRYVEAHDPFTVSEAYELKEYIVEEDHVGKEPFFKLINTGTIDPYLNFWGSAEIRYLKGRFVRPVIRRRDLKQKYPRRYSQACSSKIVISGMRKFEAFLDADGEYVAGKSTVVVTAKDQSISLLTLLGILNSRLVRFFIQETFGVLVLMGALVFRGTS
jgi:Eco57I restriction-modification methylase/N-6 DNA Methylase